MSITQGLFYGFILMWAFPLRAQTPQGEIAGNFTLTDIEGNTHSLYDYLDQGKMVVIDISATWCGPCWNYHQSGALNEFYNQHGPASIANDAMVFFIEGDVNTTLDDLHGTGSQTLGDWITGENMPIIDLTPDSFNDFSGAGLGIPYFPVMYVICPNRVIIRSGVGGQIGAIQALNYCLGLCPAPAAFPTDPAFMAYSGNTASCASFDLKVMLQNYGTEPLTNTVISVDGIPAPFTYNWTGYLETYDTTIVDLGALSLSASDTALITIASLDSNTSNSTIAQPLHYIGVNPPLVVNTVVDFSNPLFPYTDWQLINPDNKLTWEYSPIMSGMLKMRNYSYDNPDGLQRDHFITQAFDVSGEANPALLFKVAYRRYHSSYIDSLKVSVSENCTGPFTDVYIKQDTLLATGPDQLTPFTPSMPSDFRQECVDLSPWAFAPRLYVRFTNVLGLGNNLYIDDISVSGASCTSGLDGLGSPSSIHVYPNPATDQISIKTDGSLTGALYAVYDMTGRLVLNGTIVSENTVVDLGPLSGGLYFVSVGNQIKRKISLLK